MDIKLLSVKQLGLNRQQMLAMVEEMYAKAK